MTTDQLVRTSLRKGAIVGITFLACASASIAQDVTFLPATAAHGYAVRTYEAIWTADGAAIVAALEARTCLPFAENEVAAIVADATSNSGGPEHPMQLRASYSPEVKRATLVHELGHRHLWQLEHRLEEIDGHETLYLILDLVWTDVWGEVFAAERVNDESQWRSNYDYAAAWDWARALQAEERARLWAELLALNGLEGSCSQLQTTSAAE